jgi:hypothetical protein
MKRLSRRSLLRGAGGVALSLPFLEATARAQQVPQRLLVFVHGQGTVLSKWKPAQVGTTFDLPPLLAPLARHQSKLNVWSGLNNNVRRMMGGNGHNAPGRSLMSANVFSDPGNESSAAAGPSMEQVLAARIQGGAPFRSIDLRVGGDGVGEYQMFFAAKDVPVSGEADPAKAFARMTRDLTAPGGAPAPATAATRLRANRVAVMDAVKDSYRRVSAALGTEDRVRLEQHIARVTELDQSLTVKPPAAAAPARGCQKVAPALPAGYRARDVDQENAGSRAQIQNAVLALACDLTRVVTIQYTTYHGPTFSWLGLPLTGNWHDRVHSHGGDNPEAMAQAFAWYTGECDYLLSQLEAVNEGAGSLLDNTLVLWVSEFGDGGTHDTRNLPVVLAGGLGGKLKTGRHLAFGGRSHNDLFTTVLNLFGGQDRAFGAGGSDLNQGPLPIT